MKRTVTHSALLLLLTIFTSLVTAQTSQNTKAGSSSQQRNPGSFNALSLNIPATVMINQSNESSFVIEGKQEILDQVITEVKGDELIIRNRDNKWKWPGDQHIIITISNPKFNALEVNGSGEIQANTNLSADNLRLTINGSGAIITKEISSNSVTALINGSGNIHGLQGSVEQFTMEINGSGNIKADQLQSKRSTVDIAGSGNVVAGSIEALDVNIAGSGNVYYQGKSENVVKKIAGSGKVSQQ